MRPLNIIRLTIKPIEKSARPQSRKAPVICLVSFLLKRHLAKMNPQKVMAFLAEVERQSQTNTQ